MWRKPATCGFRPLDNSSSHVLTTAFPALLFCGFPRGLFRRFLLCGFFLGRFLFRRRLFPGWRFFDGRLPGSRGRRWSFHRRFRSRTILSYAGFLFLFFLLVKILFQCFAVGATVAVFVHFVIPAPEGPI